MKRKRGLISVILGIFVFCAFVVSGAKPGKGENITITTYYPAPFGVYMELRAQRMVIGENYYDPSEYCWPGGSCTFPDIGGDLIVEGEVGIGTRDPEVELHVKSSTGNADIGLESNSGYRWTISTIAADGKWILNRDIPGTLPVIIVTQDGNVGIGAIEPGAKLNIVSDFPGGGPTIMMQNLNSGGDAAIDFMNSAGVIRGNIAYVASGGVKRFVINQSKWTSLHLNTIINEGGGNVGIGTTSPATGSRLHVKGGDIRVEDGSFVDDGSTLNVPDYVFEPGYNLKPLSEVENFVLEHKHLEGLPGLGDTNGWASLSLQDRDMKLLEKVEELTLYIIELERKIAKLN